MRDLELLTAEVCVTIFASYILESTWTACYSLSLSGKLVLPSSAGKSYHKHDYDGDDDDGLICSNSSSGGGINSERGVGRQLC